MNIRDRLINRTHREHDIRSDESFIAWKKELNKTMFKTLALTIGMQIAAALFIALLFSR